MEEKIYIVVESDVVDGNTNVTVKAFRNREDAEKHFNARIEDARKEWDTDAMEYQEDIDCDIASIYINGRYMENHFIIAIFEKTLQ